MKQMPFMFDPFNVFIRLPLKLQLVLILQNNFPKKFLIIYRKVPATGPFFINLLPAALLKILSKEFFWKLVICFSHPLYRTPPGNYFWISVVYDQVNVQYTKSIFIKESKLITNSPSIYLFKVNNGKTGTMCEIRSHTLPWCFHF